MTKTHTPFKIKSIVFRNRIGMSPMCQYSSQDGYIADWHLQHYTSRAVGGVGLVIVEAAAVQPEGRITPYDLGVWSDDHIPGLTNLAEQIKANGSVAAIQLAHAGRKASHDKPANGSSQLHPNKGGWRTVAPSAIAFEKTEILPVAVNYDEILQIVDAFRSAAQRAHKAGFQIIEIHAAHGYLLHQFMSPLSNQRTDGFGGSFENRISFLLQVVNAVKEVWPVDLPIFVRLSISEWAEGGWAEEDSIRLIYIMKELGVDLVDCSSGGNISSAKIPLKPMYQVAFAENVKNSGILSAAVGLITQKEEIDYILENKKADLVLLGRELLRNPYFVNQEYREAEWPEQYLRAVRNKV